MRSFGTEDRETQFPVGPQNQVYEYILFRGSDIKDIRVVNSVNSLPNDPAIVQVIIPFFFSRIFVNQAKNKIVARCFQMTVQQPSMGQQSYQPQPGYGQMGPMGPMGPMGQFNAPYGMMGAMGPVMGMPSGNRDPRGQMNKQPSELNLAPNEPSSAVNIQNSLPTANVDPLPKDQTLEDGKLFLLCTFMPCYLACQLLLLVTLLCFFFFPQFFSGFLIIANSLNKETSTTCIMIFRHVNIL